MFLHGPGLRVPRLHLIAVLLCKGNWGQGEGVPYGASPFCIAMQCSDYQPCAYFMPCSTSWQLYHAPKLALLSKMTSSAGQRHRDCMLQPWTGITMGRFSTCVC